MSFSLNLHARSAFEMGHDYLALRYNVHNSWLQPPVFPDRTVPPSELNKFSIRLSAAIDLLSTDVSNPNRALWDSLKDRLRRAIGEYICLWKAGDYQGLHADAHTAGVDCSSLDWRRSNSPLGQEIWLDLQKSYIDFRDALPENLRTACAAGELIAQVVGLEGDTSNPEPLLGDESPIQPCEDALAEMKRTYPRLGSVDTLLHRSDLADGPDSYAVWVQKKAAASWLDLLSALAGEPATTLPAVQEEVPDQVDQNIFRRVDDEWHFRYDGGDVKRLGDMVGLHFIHELLRKPGRKLSAFELSKAAPSAARSQHADSCTPSDGPDALQVDGTLDDGPVMDKEGLTKCQEEFKRLLRLRARAEKDNDHAKIDDLNREIDELAHAVQSTRAPDGTPKNLHDMKKRASDRVTKAIGRAIEKIGVKNPRLEKHLLLSLETGFFCQYSPENSTGWIT